MASFESANMNLVIPTVGVEPGPNWANDLNKSLLTIDGHNHSPGSGVQIPPAGLDINSDLTYNDNNAVSLRTVRFEPQITAPTLSTDIGCLYEVGNELFYRDGIMQQVQITNNGSLAGAAGTITGLPSGTASAVFESSSGTFQFQQATGVGANIDGASVIIRYPGSYPTPSGNAIILEAPTSLASQYAITLPALPSENSFLSISSAGVITATTPTAINIASSSAININIGVGGTTPVPLTGSSISLETNGGPVSLMLQPFFVTGQLSFISAPLNATYQIQIIRDSVVIANFVLTTPPPTPTSSPFAINVPSTVISFLDTTAAAGGHTYSLSAFCNANNLTFQNLQWVAYEIA
jgi:hypothetical protein